MTGFEALILLAAIAIEIIFIIHSDCVIKKIKEINYTQSGLNSKLQSILDVCSQQMSVFHTILQQLKELYSQHYEFESNAENTLAVIADKIKELVDFEKRNEQRNDEMFARCEEINKLQLAELKAKVHTDDAEPFPFVPSGATTWPSCYVGGLCTNPHRDCINCPRPNVSGGTWTTNTSIKAKDAPLQERFNDNKKD